MDSQQNMGLILFFWAVDLTHFCSSQNFQSTEETKATIPMT